MSKRRRFDQALTAKPASQETKKDSRRPLALVGLIAALIVGGGVTAYAANDLLHGHIVTERRVTNAPVGTVMNSVEKSSPNSRSISTRAEDLVNQYGEAADSPAVAAAIRKAESAPIARQAADQNEALQHGVWKPGADPMLAIMHGYVPPNMDPQQARMLYSALPHFQKSPRMAPMTPEMIEQLAGGSPFPSGFDQQSIGAANQQMFEGHMRQRFGPIYVPALHREHNNLVSQKDNQMSLIQPEYAFDSENGPPKSIREMTDSSGNVVSQYGYDPYGRQTKIGGSGPDADFGYAGTYVHQRSGLLMMGARVYNPSAGRFMSRDPINEPGFKMQPKSPEPSEPRPMVVAALPSGAIMPLATAMPHNPYELAMVAHRTSNYPLLRSASPGFDINPYTYVLNNPINSTDPTGLGEFCKPDPAPHGPDWGTFWACIAQCAHLVGNWPLYIQCFNDCYYGVGRCQPCNK